MKKIFIGLLSLLSTALFSNPATAWMHAGGGSWNASGFRGSASGGGGSWSASGYRGGTASGGDGSWSGTGFRGGTASGGDGSWSGTGFRGGTASGGDGSWTATNRYGTTAYGGYDRYYGGTYATYHPPTVINTYSTGCYNCGGWYAAGAAAAGAAIGAASANTANTNAYAAGYTVGSAANTAYGMGAIYAVLPTGCVARNVGSTTYYECNGTWFSPSFGANGVYYRVVPTP